MPIDIDRYSVSAKPLEMSFEGTSLSTGTGFVWRTGEQAFLITNWHNVTGINPRTGEHLSPKAAEPDALTVHFDLVGSPPGTRGPVLLPLREADHSPRWLQHPMVRGVDVVALPLPALPGAELHPINEMPSYPMFTGIGMDAFILGYPFGVRNSSLPVWKRASIASEPGIAIGGQPCFYVDTASRPGMSGSPVILRSRGSYDDEEGHTILGGGTATRCIGIYSGRIGAKDELQAQLGLVWRAELIAQITTNGRTGSLEP